MSFNLLFCIKNAIAYWKTLIWSAFMVFVFLLPSDNLSKVPAVPGLSQLTHIFMFSIFTWIFIKDQIRVRSLLRPITKIYLNSFIFSLLFGTAIEVLQNVSGFGRTAEFLDLVYDVSGCLLAIAILIFFYLYRQNK